MKAAGYRQGVAAEETTFRRRAYYHDSVDFEWEITEYLTPDPAIRHQ